MNKKIHQKRLEILRVLIHRYFDKKRSNYSEEDFNKQCNAVLSKYLVKYNHDVEKLIDLWRAITPESCEVSYSCKNCGYVRAFCFC